jgi:methylmalonyl-CoA epimerase
MKVDHVGIAVRNLAESLPRWERALGGSGSPPEEVPSQRTRVSFLDVGTTHVEFLEPTDPSSAIGRFLEKHGPGMHHMAFLVPSVDQKLAELAQQGARLIDTVSRPGARGRRVGFVHPNAFDDVLVEFVEGGP